MRSEMMIIPFIVYGVFNGILNIAMVSSEDQLSVVPWSANLYRFYEEMKRLHCVREPESDSRADIDDICAAVLSSAHFFYHHEVRPISMSDEWVQSQLENYTDPYSPNFAKGLNYRRITLFFTHLDEEISEDVIACGAKKRRTGTFQLYFISRKYDFGCMTEAAFCDKNRHTGRFVFHYEKNASSHFVIALTENPVTVLEFRPQKREYDEKVFFADAVERNARRCNHLTSLEKLRLCSVALNANVYKGMVVFLSREEDVQPECENVDLFYPYTRRERTCYDKLKNVSVFKCKAKFVETGTPVDYFISGGDGNHTYFISRREGDRMLIRKYFYSYNLGAFERT